MLLPLLNPAVGGAQIAARSVVRPWVWMVGVVLLVAWSAFLYVATRPYNNVWQALYHNAGVPEGFEIRGIDVSHYQGIINWERVSRADIKDAPVSFVIIKATEGARFKDKQFKRNFRESQRYGLLRGAYHYFSPGVPVSEQVTAYTDSVKLEAGDLPPVLDIEDVGDLSPEEIRDAALTWMLLVEDHYGVTPILYTNLRFKERYLSGKEFDRYPFWIAHYYVPALSWKGEWKFWQHTDRGRLPGIQTFVDFNVYNGSMYDLLQLCVKEKSKEDNAPEFPVGG